MADTKLSALTQVSVPDPLDLLYGVDVSDVTDGAGGSSRAYLVSRLAGIMNHICQGRLTLTSGTAVTTADVTAATSVYFTPCNGQCVSLYDGTRWRLYVFTELTLALGTLTSAKPYDVFLYDNSGTLTLELLAWTSGTARATALVRQDGVWCKTGALTRRYLGTFYTTATTTTEDSDLNRLVWNLYNQVSRRLKNFPAGHSIGNGVGPREYNNDTSARTNFVLGLAEQTVTQTVQINTSPIAATNFLAYNSLDGATTAVSAAQWAFSAAVALSPTSVAEFIPAVGFHYLTIFEQEAGSTGSTINSAYNIATIMG